MKFSSVTLSGLHLSSKSLPGVLEDIQVPHDGVSWEGASFGSICVCFIKIGHQEPSRDSNLSSKSPPLVLRIWRFLKMVSDRSSFGSFCEIFIKIEHREPCKDSIYFLGIFLESWGTWMFLMNLMPYDEVR